MKRVTVVGGSGVSKDSSTYRSAERLGELLAKAGYEVACGGYSGVMEAVARGARRHNGSTLGFTISVFGTANPFIQKEIPSRQLLHRLHRLVEGSVAIVALRGSIGTLAEVFLVWNLRQMKLTATRLILLGQEWRDFIGYLRETFLVRDKDLALLEFAQSPEEAMKLIELAPGGT